MLSSLYSGISGLQANSNAISVVGNNIANSNTIGFKSSKTTFCDLLYQSISSASGTSQVGRGTSVSSITTNFAQGSFETTENATDLAIGDGDGFFIVHSSPDSETSYYTRAGQFDFDNDGYLTTSSGYILQGREIDRTTNTAYGVTTDIQISQGLSEPRATSAIGMVVNLQSGSDWTGAVTTPTDSATGNNVVSQVAASDGHFPIDGDYTIDYDSGTGILTLATAGESWSGTPTTGVNTNFGGSGLDITVAIPPGDSAQTFEVQGFEAGVDLDAAASYSQCLTVYDSLGQSHQVDIYFRNTGEDPTTGQTTWDWCAAISAADSVTGTDTVVGTGELIFNSNGTLISGADDQTLSFDFSQGATQDQIINICFGSGSGGGSSTQLSTSSTTTFQTQDGYAPGELQSVSVSEDGIISGNYSNGQIINLYQITLASFNNPNGLEKEGGNLYTETIDSGVAYTNAPGNGALGKISANSLEQSNVDLATEFVNLIVYQRGYQANSRVITTTDEMLDELMNIKR